MITEVADYFETDVVNTYRVWLRYELFRGRLSGCSFSSQGKATLHEISMVMSLPGKPTGIDGGEVERYFHEGKIKEIADYCETDVVNTWLVYLRFQHMRGRLTDAGLAEELARTRAWLTEAKLPHFDEFLAAWSAARSAA